MDGDEREAIDSPMQRCVDADDIDGLLAVVSPDDIAIAWHRYHAAPRPKSYDHPDFWAIELFMGREIFQRTELHRHLLLKLVEHADEDSLGAVAAGPLEDFVSDDEDDLRWLEAACVHNPDLRIALTGMWSASYVTEATMARLDAAAGEPLPRPIPRSEWPPELLAYETAKRRLDELIPGGRAGHDQLENPTAAQRAAIEAHQEASQALRNLGGS